MKQFYTFQNRIISEMYCLWKKQGTRAYVDYIALFIFQKEGVETGKEEYVGEYACT